jgi:DNA-binding transcriptional LysR family regulator
MEHVLGVPLLDRTARGVEPTVYGQVLLRHGVVIFDELRQGIQEIGFLLDPTSGQLRIGTAEPISAILAAAIENAARQYPDITFQVLVNDTRTLLRELRDRNIDLAFTRLPAPTDDADLASYELFNEPLAIVCGVQNPWARRRKIDLGALASESWTLPPPDTFFGRFIVEGFRASGLGLPKTVVVTASTQMRYNLLVGGRFLSVLSSAILTLPPYRNSLKALPVELAGTRATVGFVALKTRDVSPLAKLFIDWMRETSKRFA